LADWELVSRVNQVPLGILDSILESFNCAEVLFSLVVDSTEYVNELVSKTAGRVVVAGYVKLSDLPPEIHVNVVHLTFLASVLVVHARSSHD